MIPVISVTSTLKRRKSGGRTFELLIDHLQLGAGRFVAVVGPSGSGKSTLLDLLGLVLRPDSCGSFLLDPGEARDPQGASDICGLWRRGAEHELARLRRAQLGYVLQTGGLLPFLSVGENIAMMAELNGRAAQREAINEALSGMGLEGYRNRATATLSGGERQRVAIIRALFHDPALILADEPTAAVDQDRARAIVSDFRALARRRGTTVVMVTHDISLVQHVADGWIRLVREDSQGAGEHVRYRTVQEAA